MTGTNYIDDSYKTYGMLHMSAKYWNCLSHLYFCYQIYPAQDGVFVKMPDNFFIRNEIRYLISKPRKLEEDQIAGGEFKAIKEWESVKDEQA